MKHDRVLADHGTELMVLRPGSVLAAAEADLRRRARNAETASARVASPNDASEAYEPYAFHRNHVRRAIDARELLTLALMDPLPGLQSDKDNTRLIYGNARLIASAIQLTEGRK